MEKSSTDMDVSAKQEGAMSDTHFAAELIQDTYPVRAGRNAKAAIGEAFDALKKRERYHTVAACEWIDWRRAMYLQNNPGVRMYDDVRTLTGEQLLRDIGFLPGIVVGSPPCQDISPANTKGKGVEGERSGLYFEAIRIIGEVRPRWFALENSANLRTRGADAVLAALEELDYACWAFVVRAGDIRANHERPRSWLIGCDLSQVANADGHGRNDQWEGRRSRLNVSIPQDTGHASEVGCGTGLSRGRAGSIAGAEQSPCGDASNTSEAERRALSIGGGNRDGEACERSESSSGHTEHAEARIHDAGHPDSERSAAGLSSSQDEGRNALSAGRLRPDADDQRGHPLPSKGVGNAHEARRQDGKVVGGLVGEKVASDGSFDGCCPDGTGSWEVGLREADSGDAFGRRADWSLDDLADHLQLDDGLSAWLAGKRIAVGGPRGTSAASLIVEAFGDAVVPQIPEAIGRAILRTERALAAVHGRSMTPGQQPTHRRTDA